MKKFLWLWLIPLLAQASTLEEVAFLLEKHSSVVSISERVHRFSSEFRGLPYSAIGPLGEGNSGNYDQDPLFRLDEFDCTTFVETTLSLALARDTSEFFSNMNLIRYENAKIDFFNRNHFASLQWIPNNIKNGIFAEANSDVISSEKLEAAEALIEFSNWILRLNLSSIRIPGASIEKKQVILDELHSHAGQFQNQIARIDYIPIRELLQYPELLKRIPDASVVSFVRPNWDLTASIGTHLNVSHQGILLQSLAGPILRHASNGPEKKVVDIPLLDYLRKFENHPTLKGIHLLRLTRSRI